ncbi:hypothetical protein Taro_030249 [Colocasia esculenta]|uniref:Uncharacterized protein n=1 Tax=Colocasia esculenta TaxID=4460 RepID=A0A843VZP9_COLES|nr:hypothetical protein [Colocasia esculenta]
MEAVPWAHSSACSFYPSSKSPFPPPRRTPPLPPSGRRRRPRLEVNCGEKVEIRVCVNRSCNRMGSREILAVLSDISPPEVSVNSCGCLGRCGAGPNLVVLPEGTLVGHCGTPARGAELLAQACRGARGGGEGSFDPRKNLEALALRKKGEVELVERGNPTEADGLLSQAIDLKPSGGLHIIYKSRSYNNFVRSVARLKLGNSVSALEDANEALKIAPNFPQVLCHLELNIEILLQGFISFSCYEAYICQGDAFMAMGELSKAEKAYLEALQIDPSIRHSKSFKERIAKLQQKVVEAISRTSICQYSKHTESGH